MPDGGDLTWWSPDPRGILRPGEVHVSRSLRRSLRRFTVSVDSGFADVVDGCADDERDHGWINAAYRDAYARLHAQGWAHSIEVWDDDGRLAGGLFGVERGGLFCAESKFHRATDASKVAVVALCAVVGADHRPERLIDVQWCTPHLASLGVREVPRPTYLGMLARALPLTPAFPWDPSAAAGPTRIRWRRA
jgi:leucyl/phenylalanyl-tRNA--protein transferase